MTQVKTLIARFNEEGFAITFLKHHWRQLFIYTLPNQLFNDADELIVLVIKKLKYSSARFNCCIATRDITSGDDCL